MFHNNLQYDEYDEVLLKLLTSSEKREVTESVADLLIELLDASKITLSAGTQLMGLYRIRRGTCEILDRANTIESPAIYDALIEFCKSVPFPSYSGLKSRHRIVFFCLEKKSP